MFSNFFDGKKIKNYIQQKYSPNRTNTTKEDVQKKEVEKRKQNQSPISANNNISNTTPNKSNQFQSKHISERVCTTPDNISKHTQSNFIQKFKSNGISNQPKSMTPTHSQKDIQPTHQSLKQMKEQLQQLKQHNTKPLLKNQNDYNMNLEQQKKLKNNKLIYYTKINDWEKCLQLLSRKSNVEVNVNCKDESNWTPLHFACFNNNLQLVTFLVAKDADLNFLTNSGLNGLMIAAQKGADEIVSYLTDKGVNVNQVDRYQNTALHYACLGNNQKVVEILLSHPDLDITIHNFENKPAFELTKNQQILAAFNDYFTNKQKQIQKKKVNEKINEAQNQSKDQNQVYDLDLEQLNGPKTLPSDFYVHGLLGKGSFGEVYLVEKKETQEIFAMKALDKSKIAKNNLIKYAMTERNVLSLTNHPFIVKLNYAFQTIDKLFLVLEFAPGGDLGELLQNEQKFPEEKAKLYICEITLALEDLHKKDIIFRDLKPENIVLDQEGHALLTDFGLSKEGVFDPSVGARSFCGSVAYLAPEMLKRQGHGKAVDWYLLGVVLYEMLVGIPPYYANSREQLFYNIENGILKIPSSISEEAKSLLKALLQRNPLKRLGSGKGDAEEIKCHPFFNDVDWNVVINRGLNLPKVAHKIKINPKYTNKTVFSQTISKDDQEYVSGWSFVNKDN